MTRLLIGNDFDPTLRVRVNAAWYGQRIAWFARDDDVLVVPTEPEDGFLEYITALTDTRLASLRVVVPPQERPDTALLTGDRLADEEFLANLRTVVADRRIEEVISLWPDASVSTLARTLGVPEALAGYGFLSQGGGAVVNSKVVFRAVAAGIGVPVPAGSVATQPRTAEAEIVRQFAAGYPVILKREYMSGCRGNEIVSPTEGVRQIGAQDLVVLAGDSTVRDYLARRWDWLTDGQRNPLVVERYYPDSLPYFAEFLLTDSGVALAGQGEIIPSEVAYGEILPPTGLDTDEADNLIENGRRLAVAVHAMGYRGFLSADAIITPDRELFFTEYNGRITGSTHVYEAIGKRLAGERYAEDRVILECVSSDGWSVHSFQEAADRLGGSGLGFDRRTRTGVVLSSAFHPARNSMHYCVIEETVEEAEKVQDRLRGLFSIVPTDHGRLPAQPVATRRGA